MWPSHCPSALTSWTRHHSFSRPTADLLNRPDLLRSVFLTDIAAPSITGSTAAPTDEVALEVAGLARSFGGNHAVRDVSFSVGTGEIVGMIGPNGAGKTTLFDLISGYVAADAGRVVLDGRDITSDSATARARRGLGRSFQRSALPRHELSPTRLQWRWNVDETAQSVPCRCTETDDRFDDEERPLLESTSSST